MEICATFQNVIISNGIKYNSTFFLKFNHSIITKNHFISSPSNLHEGYPADVSTKASNLNKDCPYI